MFLLSLQHIAISPTSAVGADSKCVRAPRVAKRGTGYWFERWSLCARGFPEILERDIPADWYNWKYHEGFTLYLYILSLALERFTVVHLWNAYRIAVILDFQDPEEIAADPHLKRSDHQMALLLDLLNVSWDFDLSLWKWESSWLWPFVLCFRGYFRHWWFVFHIFSLTLNHFVQSGPWRASDSKLCEIRRNFYSYSLSLADMIRRASQEDMMACAWSHFAKEFLFQKEERQQRSSLAHWVELALANA